MTTGSPEQNADRVADHRSRKAATGSRRVEVTVPVEHVELIRAVARLSRDADASDDGVASLQELVEPGQRPARTGDELVAFFRSFSPLGQHHSPTSGRSMTSSATLPMYVDAISPYAISGRWGEHRRPEPGMPRVSTGTVAPVAAPLFADSGTASVPDGGTPGAER